jgi:DNA-binding MarR family transcriptional regulator/N-acetylglutamate synthase-like GNAT family acetyltransferase
MVELISKLGELAFASRLKRLSETLMQDVSQLYHDCGLEFEPKWFLIFYQLGRGGPQSVTGLALQIGVTHPAVNQAAADLIKLGLLEARTDRNDKRRRMLSLSPKGKQLYDKLDPVWQEVRMATAELIAESDSNLLQEIENIERSLETRSMYQRVKDRLKQKQQDQIEIVDYQPAYKKYFRQLNLEWIKSYFSPEPRDLEMLNDPRHQIINRGGEVMFARLDDRIIGTCAIVPNGFQSYELIKMVVAPDFRGRQAGKKLALAAIDRARARKARELVARTSPRLEAANKLYRSLGFEYGGRDKSRDYQRQTIVLKLNLSNEKDRENKQ